MKLIIIRHGPTQAGGVILDVSKTAVMINEWRKLNNDLFCENGINFHNSKIGFYTSDLSRSQETLRQIYRAHNFQSDFESYEFLMGDTPSERTQAMDLILERFNQGSHEIMFIVGHINLVKNLPDLIVNAFPDTCGSVIISYGSPRYLEGFIFDLQRGTFNRVKSLPEGS